MPTRIPKQIRAGLIFGATLLIFSNCTTANAQWTISPEVRLSGGDESDIVIDPGLTRAVVPGGSYTEFMPGITVRRWLGGSALLDAGTFATVQRFLNTESRLLYAHTIWSDLMWGVGGRFQGRFSASIDYFDDSERDSVRRFGGGGELGISLLHAGWSGELWGGGRGRRYPNLDVLESSGRVSTYEETSWSGGATLRFAPHAHLAMRAGAIVQTTDSQDPLFDSESHTLSAGVEARLAPRIIATTSGTVQDRTFTQRAAPFDGDEYWQIGLGVRYVVAGGWDLSTQWGYSTYTWPDGSDESTHRLSVGVRYSWSRQHVPIRPRADLDALVRGSGESVQQPDGEGNVRFRVQAPGARAVSVAGSFNGWNAEATPLRSVGGGWWETRVELASGIYEYAYVVDGEWKTPPEASLTAEDGFGGINGILEVLSIDA